MDKTELLEAIQQNERFQHFSTPFVLGETENEVKDAEFLLRRDGTIFNVEGWNHPTEFLVGEILYVPDEHGDKTIFGQTYRKVTLYKGTFEPVPYPERASILRAIDPSFDQHSNNPYFARYKQIFPASDFIAHLPSARAFKQAFISRGHETEKFHEDLENLMNLLGIHPEDISLGLTGAPSLGNLESYHDLDIVFSGSLEQNLVIARKMKEIVLHEPKRRLFEGGKAWQIRFFNDNHTLMCTFFTYPDRELAPLANFEMEIIEDNIAVEGTVSDDAHSMYTPTLLELTDACVTRNGQFVERLTRIPLIVYHTASRGDCFNGDVIRANGALVTITKSNKESFLAICVIDREGLRNLTPPWENYYL